MKSTQKKKNKIEYGDVDFGSEEFDPRQGEFRVNMWLDLDLLDVIRIQAKKDGMKYQPWINQKLREVLMGEKSFEKRLFSIEQKLKEIELKRA